MQILEKEQKSELMESIVVEQKMDQGQRMEAGGSEHMIECLRSRPELGELHMSERSMLKGE